MPDDPVTLTDLEVIQRWSLAVRQASADRGELVAALRNDLDWLEGRPRGDADDADERPAPRRTTRTATRRSTGTTTRSAGTTRRKA